MPPERNLEEVGVPEIIEGIQALFLAPIVLPVTAGINQPLVKAAIKEGIALSERCKEALAEAGETFDDLAAEVRAELAEKRQAEQSSESVRTWVREGESEAAVEIINVMSTLNEQVGRITNGVADLRLLLPLGLGALALRQLVAKGFEIDEIPWYTLAWYAFDTFNKLNHRDTPSTVYPVSDSELMQTAADAGTP